MFQIEDIKERIERFFNGEKEDQIGLYGLNEDLLNDFANYRGL